MHTPILHMCASVHNLARRRQFSVLKIEIVLYFTPYPPRCFLHLDTSTPCHQFVKSWISHGRCSQAALHHPKNKVGNNVTLHLYVLLQYEWPCCIGYTNSRQEVVCSIQHGCKYCKGLLIRMDVNVRICRNDFR